MIYETQTNGCVELVWAVILQAVRDAIQPLFTGIPGNWREKFEARQIALNKTDALEWIESTNGEEHEGSFKWYCHLIGMDGVPRIIKKFIKEHNSVTPISPFIGEIRKAREIGKVGYHSFMWTPCGICHKTRWVCIKQNQPVNKICKKCSGRINNLKNQK